MKQHWHSIRDVELFLIAYQPAIASKRLARREGKDYSPFSIREPRRDAPMHLIAPDILFEARGLSPALSGFALLVGVLIWTCGWRWHRFWVVSAVTVAGGLIGLQTGRASGGHILAIGVLLALSAGLLALELARLFVFIASGLAVWMAARLLFPNGQELWVAFLIGGLLGVFLYRFWTMVLTSATGVLLGGNALLACLDEWFHFDAAAFAARNATMLNGAAIALTIGGVLVQSLLERWHLRQQSRKKKEQEEMKLEKERAKILAGVSKSSPASMWDRLLGRKKKAA
jgi:hypothetical protein